AGAGERGPLPRRPVLPAQRADDHPAAAARAARGHPAAGQGLPRAFRPPPRPAGAPFQRRCQRRPARLRLAGQHPRAAERDRTRLHPLPGRGTGRRVPGAGPVATAAGRSRRADVAGGTGTPAHPARAGRNRHPGSRRPRPRHRRLHPVPQAQGLRTVTERARRRRRMYTSLLVAVVVVLLASSLLSLHTTARLSESVAAVSHTQRLQERINRLWGLLGDRDTHILRYLLLGRELHVEEFHNILRQMEKAQAQLQQEVGDDPVQRAALAEIDRLHQERIERAEYLIALNRRSMAGEPGVQELLDEEFEAIPSNGNAEAMRALLEAMSEH